MPTDELEQVIREQQERWTVPGIAWGVRQDGEEGTGALGVAKLTTGEPMRADSLCRIASISKVFTATLAMVLADEGTLDLDAPVSQYLPGVRVSEAGIEERITPRHLLSHGTGMLGDYFVDQGLGEDALARAIGEFHTLRQYAEPDELWFYCNSGFHLAGRIIEVVASKPFDAVMRERLFEPLGLERTCFFAHEAIVYPHAIGHNQVAPDADEHVPAGQYYPRNRLPAGGVYSNVPDLLRFARFHLGDGTVEGRRVISEGTLRAMREPQRSAANWADQWGIGWDLREIDGVQVIAHGGSINGFKSLLTLVPERQAALVLLTNSGRGDAANRAIERWWIEHEMGLRLPERPRVALDDAALARLAGRYHGPDTTIELVRDGDLRLEMTAPGPNGGNPVPWPAETLVPIGDSEFVTTTGPSAGERLDIVPDAAGNPRYLRRHGRLFDRDAGCGTRKRANSVLW
ncbi:MAG TPA: serine hydrolase domain-containing protein [Thermomicrobiales bacterium]|nr:serine hydrolase domain-containing protein [Thermomicrobiales bacterium]